MTALVFVRASMMFKAEQKIYHHSEILYPKATRRDQELPAFAIKRDHKLFFYIPQSITLVKIFSCGYPLALGLVHWEFLTFFSFLDCQDSKGFHYDVDAEGRHIFLVFVNT